MLGCEPVSTFVHDTIKVSIYPKSTMLRPLNWGVVYNKSNHKIPSMKDPFYYKMIRKIPRSTLNMKSPLKVECGYSLD